MAQFADRLIQQILAKNSRSIVGLDPRVDQMPAFVRGHGEYAAITAFHELVIEAVADLVPAVKPQLAFFEQYGVVGMQAFENTVLAAKKRGLLVIADVMRNPAGTKLAWDFVRAHWNEIANLGGAFGGGMIVENTSSFCDAGMRDEVKDFFAAHHAPAAERSLKQSLERINYCVDLKAQQGTQLASWLQTHGSAAGE